MAITRTTYRDYQERLTPVEAERNRRATRRRYLLGAIVLLLAIYLAYRYAPNRPVTYANIEEHFKYGSIGSDIENGLPLRIIKVLPRMFPEYLPSGAPRDYTAFGFIQEPGREMPVGFSTRRRIVDLVGLNCSACHVGVVRASERDAPKRYLAMPSNTVDVLGFFQFLFKCAGDKRFTPEKVLAEMDKDGRLFPLERLINKRAVSELRTGLLVRQAQLSGFLSAPGHPGFGPGRVDTFNPYKVNQFAEHYRGGVPNEECFGTVDFPSIWNQKIRHGMQLHWDGNNTSVRERNLSAAFGAGATRENVDLQSIARIEGWMDALPPPKYPFPIDQALARRGEAIYDRHCFDCHGVRQEGGKTEIGKYVGRVDPIGQIRTDPYRLNSYTEKLRNLQLEYGKGYPWQFKNFRKTDGYANAPLDGIWARAPYLHNGSVPTLWDLLLPEAKRSSRLLSSGGKPFFYIGHGVYDPKNVGFRTDVKEIGGRPSYVLDVTAISNSNKGHTGKEYGTELPDADKWALIEYMKTL